MPQRSLGLAERFAEGRRWLILGLANEMAGILELSRSTT
jgi:hypothetical protein